MSWKMANVRVLQDTYYQKNKKTLDNIFKLNYNIGKLNETKV